jgi:hypothetical protein
MREVGATAQDRKYHWRNELQDDVREHCRYVSSETNGLQIGLTCFNKIYSGEGQYTKYACAKGSVVAGSAVKTCPSASTVCKTH